MQPVLQQVFGGRMLQRAFVPLVLLACAAAGAKATADLGARLLYELRGPLTWDTPLYLAVGRGILNGLLPYRDLFEVKPPGIFFLSALSLFLPGRTLSLTAAQVTAIAGIPLTLVVFAWKHRPASQNSRRYLAFSLAYLSGILLALYTAERSGELQVESFGAFFGVLYAAVIAGRGTEKGWKTLMWPSLFLFLAVGMKEPFLLAALAAALLLTADNPRMFLWSFVLPCAVAAAAGLLLLLLLGYAGPYVSLNLSFVYGTYIIPRPFMLRLLAWRAVIGDFGAFAPAFGAVLLSFFAASVLTPLHRAPAWLMERRFLAAILAVIILVFAVGTGTQFFNHHYVFAVPVYASCILLVVRDMETDQGRLSFSLACALAILVAVAVFTVPAIDYPSRLQSIRAQVAPAHRTARSTDGILEACGLTRYLFLGRNGYNPYGYTMHSPYGPIFQQNELFLHPRYAVFRERFLDSVQEAQLIVFSAYALGDLEPQVSSYVAQNFTLAPWPCARGVPPASPPFRFFFRKPPGGGS